MPGFWQNLKFEVVDQRNYAVCAVLGHSHLVFTDTGHFTCARCDEIVERTPETAIIGRGSASHALLTWRDKFLVPNECWRQPS